MLLEPPSHYSAILHAAASRVVLRSLWGAGQSAPLASQDPPSRTTLAAFACGVPRRPCCIYVCVYLRRSHALSTYTHAGCAAFRRTGREHNNKHPRCIYTSSHTSSMQHTHMKHWADCSQHSTPWLDCTVTHRARFADGLVRSQCTYTTYQRSARTHHAHQVRWLYCCNTNIDIQARAKLSRYILLALALCVMLYLFALLVTWWMGRSQHYCCE